MSWSSAPNGAMRARARSSTGCRSAPISWCAFRAATMPVIRWWSTASPISSRCFPRAWCARASSRSSATASWSIPGRSPTRSPRSRNSASPSRRDNLRIAENATLILPLHRELDALREAAAGAGRIGTTKRGIGPAYEDKVGRRAIRVMDLAGPAEPQAARSSASSPITMRCAAAWASPKSPATSSAHSSPRSRRKVLPYVDTVWALLDAQRRQGKRILFEGAQGALLDIDHGTYPFVTSSNTVAAQAATGSGLGPGAINYVLGITKAYTTRVGEGPFPTELKDETGKLIGERGVEFGTVTGGRAAAAGSTPCLVRQTRKVARHRRHRADQARRARRAAGAQDLRRLPARRQCRSIICRRRKRRRPACSRSTRRWKAGRNRRAARAPGPSFPRNASNMCAGSRS